MDKAKIKVDGREISALVGTTVLEAAKNANIYIPNLCNNEELTPAGACRLCVVEVIKENQNRVLPSCILKVADGLEVKTKSEKAIESRQEAMRRLLGRNSTHPKLRKIAEDIGITEFGTMTENKGCILCGLCVRTCREVVGANAIRFEGKGEEKKVVLVLDENQPGCIACGSCSYICPVQVIPMEDKNGVRTIWKTDFPLQKCTQCGRYFAPVKQLEYFRKLVNLPEDHFNKCKNCR